MTLFDPFSINIHEMNTNRVEQHTFGEHTFGELNVKLQVELQF